LVGKAPIPHRGHPHFRKLPLGSSAPSAGEKAQARDVARSFCYFFRGSICRHWAMGAVDHRFATIVISDTKTASLTVPPSLLATADEVIE
jgi:hypothetical protein